MAEIIEPNYLHYTRIETISATNAQRLLAVFEVRGKVFEDEKECQAAFNAESAQAFDVLWDAIKHRVLKPDLSHPDLWHDDLVREKYDFDVIYIKTALFLKWAVEHQYNVPDVLVKLAHCSKEIPGDHTEGDKEEPVAKALEQQLETEEKKVDAERKNDQQVTSPSLAPQSKQNGNENGGGRPEDSLAEAVRHAYDELKKNQDEVWRIKKGNVREFIEFLKFMVTVGNPHADKYVMERIESVKCPRRGDCTVKTQERRDVMAKSKGRGIPKPYNQRHVSRILIRLRAEPKQT